MYELEFIPIKKVDNFGELIDSTWVLHESKELDQELLDFIENEFEDDIGDFEKVIVYEEECYNVPINIIQL
tara:strand:+ start:210 stop:422 length:213 start_codon:yes stop_codon:yes gene_type:complete